MSHRLRRASCWTAVPRLRRLPVRRRGMGVAGSDGAGDVGGWRVFISHTSELRDFPAEGTSYVAAAERAVSAAGHVIVDMADFPAADQPAAQVCAERVRGCDVYVGVLGTRYGSPVRDRRRCRTPSWSSTPPPRQGWTGWCSCWIPVPTMSGSRVGQLIDHEFGARQEAFRRRVQDSGLITQSFASPDQLGQLVERSLRELAQTRRGTGPLPPGSVLRVWNIPARNPGFTGRDELLAAVRERLLAGDRAVVQALQGQAGVGKTQLAIEYAHRFADSYDLAWWVNCRAGRADRGSVRRAGRGAGLCPGRGRAWRWCGRRCWRSCGSGGGGCWCSTTPRNPLTSLGGCRAGAGMC